MPLAKPLSRLQQAQKVRSFPEEKGGDLEMEVAAFFIEHAAHRMASPPSIRQPQPQNRDCPQIGVRLPGRPLTHLVLAGVASGKEDRRAVVDK